VVQVAGSRTARTLTVTSGAVDVLDGASLDVGGGLHVGPTGTLAVHGALAVGTAGYATTSTVATAIEGGGTGVLTLGPEAAFHAAGGLRDLAVIHLGAAAQLTAGPTNNTVHAIGLAPDAALDLATGNLIVDYDPGDPNPYGVLAALLASGIGSPTARTWDGPGIRSGDADDTLFALGVLDNADPPTFVEAFDDSARPFEGEGVDATTVLVKYTYYGDCNLDGAVTPVDVQRLIQSWNGATEGDPRWAVGDFNYDGTISPTDVQLLIFGWNQQGGPLAAGVPVCAAPSATPEPATLLLLAGGAAAALARRRQ